MDKLVAVVSKETYNKVDKISKKLAKSGRKLIADYFKSGEDITVTFDLTAIPVINQKYAKNSVNARKVYDITLAQLNLKAKQKVLSYFIKLYKASSVQASGSQYTKEQLDVLKVHGIDYTGAYSGVDNKVSEKNENDFYYSRELEFAIDKMKTLPKVEDVLKKMKEGSKLTPIQQVMADQITELVDDAKAQKIKLLEVKRPTKALKSFLIEQKNLTKLGLLEFSSQMTGVLTSVILTNEWFTGGKPDSKGNYTFEFDDKKFLIKASRAKVYF